MNHGPSEPVLSPRPADGRGGPLFEGLEARLLLAAGDPSFATQLAEFYSITAEKGLTVGIDGFDDDGGPLTITAVSSDAEVVTSVPTGNQFALMHFADSEGTPIGDILVQLFETRSPLATERFITLAENHVDADGTLDPGGVPFYTDVVVDLVIPGFVLETGDAENGDGTGGSPLGAFDDEFHADLSFAGPGVLTMTNSGVDTNDSRFLLTSVPTTWLDGLNTVFGQLISGWDVYDAITNVPTDENNRPLDPALLQSVEIIDSPQDGTVTMVASEDFAGQATVTVTLTDGEGHEVSQVITLIPEADVGEMPQIGTLDAINIDPDDNAQVTFGVDYDGDSDIAVSASSNYVGEGEIALVVLPSGVQDNEYDLYIAVPAQYDGQAFAVSVSATLEGYGNLLPATSQFDVVTQMPEIAQIPAVGFSPGQVTDVPVEVSYDGPWDVVVSAASDYSGDGEVLLTVEQSGGEGEYVLHVAFPAEYDGQPFAASVSATLAGFSDLAPIVAEFSLSLGARPIIVDPGSIFASGGVLATVPLTVFDGDSTDFVLTIEADLPGAVVSIDQVTHEASITPPGGFEGSFNVTVTAVEDEFLVDYPDLAPGEGTFEVSTTVGLAAPLADFYTIEIDQGLTVGVDGFDPAGGALSVTAVSDDPNLDLSIPAGNQYALMHFTDSEGTPIGDILIQLFETRSPLATERFITLAQNHVDSDGTLDPGGVPFYTDVVIHRIIPGFMFQSGDAENGDGTGGSPLGSFADQFHADLSFAGRGALAMANSGSDTNDSQFFITDISTPWLNDQHTVLGQMISGEDVYRTIIDAAADSGDRPLDPPLISSIEIIDSPQDGTLTMVAQEGFAGPAEVTVTLDDGQGHQSIHTFTVVAADEVEELPQLPAFSDMDLPPGATGQALFEVDYDGARDLAVSASSNYAGEGQVGLAVVPVADVDGQYVLYVSVPEEFDGAPFAVRVPATLAGFGNLTPGVSVFSVATDLPTVNVAGSADFAVGEPADVPFEVLYDGVWDLVLTPSSDYPAGGQVAGLEIEPTGEPDQFVLHVDLPGTYDGQPFTVTLSATLAGFDSLSAATRHFLTGCWPR